jgi:hypothetical protein
MKVMLKMLIIPNLRISPKKYTVEDLRMVLNDYPLSWPALWFKALRSSCPKKSEVELMTKLVDEMNATKLPFAFSPYHALFYTLHKLVFCEWELLKEEVKDEEDLIELDKSLMCLFRNVVIKRDGFQCQLCGKQLSPEIAVVHHILPRHGFISTRKIKKQVVIGVSVPLNLISLCKDCHNKIHRRIDSAHFTIKSKLN